MTHDRESDKGTFELPGRAGPAFARKAGGASDISLPAAEDVQKPVHELHAYQVELEMQNDELRTAHIALKESRNNYQDLYDFAPVGYVTLDRKGIILEANLTAVRLLGAERHTLIQGPFPSLVRQDFRDAFYRHLRQVFETQSKQTCEIKLAEKDGTCLHVQLESVAVQDETGQFKRCRTIMVDVADRRQAEEELRKAQRSLTLRNRIAAILLTGFEVEMYADILTLVLELVDSKYGFFGYIDENGAMVCPTMTRGIWAECGTPEQDIRFPAEKWGGLLSRACTEKKAQSSNGPLCGPEGHICLRRAVVVPIIHHGDLLGAIAVADKESDYEAGDLELLEDICDYVGPILVTRLERQKAEFRRNRAEETLMESEERYRVIAENSLSGIFIHQDGVDVYVNQRLADMLGYTTEEMIGSPFLEAVHPADRESAWERAAARLNGEPAPLGYELRLVRKTGEEIWCDVLERLIRYRGRPALMGNIADITERKRSEQALRESEERFRLLVESAPDAIFVQTGGCFAYVNKAACFFLGCDSEDQLLGKPVSRHFHQSDRKAVEERIRILNIEKKPVPGREENCIRADGTSLPVEVSAVPIHFQGCDGALVFMHDISGRKKAEAALRESEERFRQVAESAGDWIWEVDASGLYRFCSPAVERILGYSSQELEGRAYFFDLFAPDVKEDLRDKALGVFARKERFRDFVNPNVRKDGTIAVLETSGVPFLDEQGNLLGYRGADRDVTEERRIQEAHKLLAKALEQTAESIVITDTDGFVAYANPAFEHITGFALQDVLGKRHDVVDLRHNDESLYQDLQNTLADGGSWAGHVVSRRKDGTLYEESVTVAPVYDDTGKTVNFVVAMRDISEALSLQKQLVQAHKMEAIGTLAGGIAHDFNNIIFVITGFTELALEDLPPESPTRSDLERVLNAGKRAGDMVKQILTFSRQAQPERKPLDLAPIIKEGLKFLRASIPTTIEIRQNIQPDLGKVFGDPTQIHQILMNLCTNAAHATRDTKGVLSVELAGVELDQEYAAAHPETTPGKYARLTVSDTGHGIPPEMLDRIFEPYFTTKKAGEGTGFGLSVVHGIVKSHGGAISVYSEIEKGTTFHAYLPLIEEDAKHEPDMSTDFIPSGNECILLVDDEQILVGMGRAILERLGYQVVTTTSPLEAVGLFLSDPHQFDLVITDLTMPNMTGEELALELKRIRPDTPIILCTGFSESLTEEHLREAGIDALIRKPILRRDMARMVRAVLDQAQSRPGASD